MIDWICGIVAVAGRPFAAARVLARERLAHLRRGAPLAQSDAEKAERGVDELKR